MYLIENTDVLETAENYCRKLLMFLVFHNQNAYIATLPQFDDLSG